MTTTPFGEFVTSIDIDGVRAIVTVHGEVDVATAPTLGGLLETLVDHGHTDLVLELQALQFLDASGVRVLARVLALLRPHQGTLLLRSVPAPTERVLRLTGFSDLIDADAPIEERSARAAAAGDPAAGRGEHLRLGALPTSNDTIDAALQLVVTLASATVRGADGVSVSLHRHGRLMTAAASDETVLEMDHNQYDTGEGPCLSAAAEGRWFRVDALAEEERWPAFTPRAIKEGIASILSSPLLNEGRPIGALNIYSRGEGAFGREEQELAALFATHVAGILVDARADLSEEESTSRIHSALVSRMLITQAQGMLMERQQVTAEVAARILGHAARAAGRTVLEQAIEVTRSVAGSGPPPADPTTSVKASTSRPQATHG